MFCCNTTMGSLLWETSNTSANHLFNNPAQSSSTLGIFRLHLNGILLINGTVTAVNSTAVVSDLLPHYNGALLKCSEYADLSISRETILKVKGKTDNLISIGLLYMHACMHDACKDVKRLTYIHCPCLDQDSKNLMMQL